MALSVSCSKAWHSAISKYSCHQALLSLMWKSPCIKIASPTTMLAQRSFSKSSFCNAAKRLYTEKHEWISVEQNVGTIGITDYAQDALGDVVYAQLPDEGSEFAQGDDFGALESVKAASELYAPVSGKIVAKNTAVEDKPGLINTSCYEEGWLIKLELSKSDELKELMDESGYEKYLKSQQEDD